VARFRRNRKLASVVGGVIGRREPNLEEKPGRAM